MSTHDPRRLALRTLAVVLVVLGLVVGGPWVYARMLAPSPDAPLALPSAPATPVTVETVTPLVLEGSWRVVEGSQAGYRLEEVLSGQPVTVVGRTSQVSGSVTLADGVMTEARVVVDAASIATDESARDAYFRRALDTSTYPQATFVLHEQVDVSALAHADAPLTVQAPGVLTFHGEGREVVASLEVQRVGEQVQVAGSIPVTLADHGLGAPELGFVTVEPAGTIELLLVLQAS